MQPRTGLYKHLIFAHSCTRMHTWHKVPLGIAELLKDEAKIIARRVRLRSWGYIEIEKKAGSNE